MKNERVPSVPLITCDPYFSVWSPSDTLFGADTCSWTGAKKAMEGIIKVDDVSYRFMGTAKGEKEMEQTGLHITPTGSYYTFRGGNVNLRLTFLTPLLLAEPELISRPCSYIAYDISSEDGKIHTVELEVSMEEGHCYDGPAQREMTGGVHCMERFTAAWMGQKKQAPLSHSGDDITIDWGYLYLAAPKDGAALSYEKRDGSYYVTAKVSAGAVKEETSGYLVAAYDDIISIMYFDEACKGYWTKGGRNILDAIGDSICQKEALFKACRTFDKELTEWTERVGGTEYAHICSLAYRQTVAAHKLIEDREGNLLFLSKECLSNGCIGTVDISYPSMPLYLLYNPELVKGMLRPVFRFSKMPVWQYDFAPHDVGRYPYVTGQVYGVKQEYGLGEQHNGKVYPMYYIYPEGSDIYRLEEQMPVEECGNMLIMSAALSKIEGNTDFVKGEMALLEKWTDYLLEYGEDPGNQLCTDDFAGHLAHNTNLAVKAIMGIWSYGLLLLADGQKEKAAVYQKKAGELAEKWEIKADAGDHTMLAFGSRESWSLKYNLIWDILFESGLFSEELFEKELDWYLKKQNRYGVPLSSRETYTKSDWILWVASFAGSKEKMRQLIAPLKNYLEETPSRVPFSDWYDSCSAMEMSFQNRTVQGGLFMPLLKEKFLTKEKSV